MSEQCSEVPAEDFIILELCKSLQIEDEFVWVDMPHTLQENDRISSTSDSSSNYTELRNILNIVHTEIVAGEPDPADEFDASKRYPVLDVELYDSEYEDLCAKNIANLFKPLKLKYPTPHWLKMNTRGIYTIEKQRCKRRELNCDTQKDDFLLAMKLDERTTAILKMLVKNRYLGKYNGLAGTGKNSLVFNAHCSRRVCTTMPHNNAVKIYKISKDETRNRMICRQVQREFEHLSILRRCRALRYQSPWAIKAKENVIVMEFFGFGQDVAPSIADLPSDKDQAVYKAIVAYMDKCYNLAYLVHGSLSARKILYWFESPCFIGWSRSVKRRHPKALHKLMRDCCFVTEFYRKRGVIVKSALDVFKQITNQEEPSEEILGIIQGKDIYDKYKTNPNRRHTSPGKHINNRFYRFK